MEADPATLRQAAHVNERGETHVDLDDAIVVPETEPRLEPYPTVDRLPDSDLRSRFDRAASEAIATSTMPFPDDCIAAMLVRDAMSTVSLPEVTAVDITSEMAVLCSSVQLVRTAELEKGGG